MAPLFLSLLTIYSSTMKKFLLLCAAVCTGMMGSAQLNQITVDELDAATFPWVNGGTAAALPAGSVTYRIYAELQDAADEVSAVFAIENCHPMNISTTTSFFNDVSFGGLTAAAINPLLFPAFPTVQPDSYVTIGALDNSDADAANINVAANLPPDAFSNSVGGAGVSMVIEDGAWFSPGGITGSGPDNRVLLGQFTTDGDFTFDINVQVFDDGDGINGNLEYVHTIACEGPGTPSGAEVTDPSLSFPSAPVVPGCTDGDALNFDAAATVDDGSCIVPDCDLADDETPIAPTSSSTICYDSGEITSVTYTADTPGDQVILVFNAGTTEVGFDEFYVYDGTSSADPLIAGPIDGSLAGLTYESTSGSLTFEIDADGSVSCVSGSEDQIEFDVYCGSLPPVSGCTDPTACNFDPLATIDDGSCIAAASNDDCGGAIALTPGTVNVDNTNACGTPEILVAPAGSSCESQDGWCSFETDVDNDVWYSFTTPTDAAQVTITTIEDGSFTVDDTQLALFDACGGNFVAGNDDIGGGNFMSQLFFDCGDLAANTTYFILVDGYNGNSGTFDLELVIDEAICVNIPGCTDADAINFNAAATADDGSCIVPDCDPADDGVAIAPTSSETYCYVNNDNTAFTYVADNAGDQVIVAFTAGTIEGCCDEVTIYDGTTDADPVVGVFTDLSDLVVESTSGALTVVFTSDFSVSCDSGSQDQAAWDVYCGSAAIAGCTDPTACNFDPAATTDDGSCVACADTCVDLVVDGAGFPGEITFDVFDSSSNLVYSGTGSDGTVTLCLADGCYTVEMFDSFGDGWNGGSIDVQVGGSSIAVIDLDGAPLGDGDSVGTDFFDIGATGTCPVLGCTDPTACNFDAGADIDDGSCVPAPCGNDVPALAIDLPIDPLGTCTGLAGEDLATAGISAPEGTFPVVGAGLDLWYSFQPPTSGVRIEVNTVSFDAVIELQDAANSPVDAEDVVFTNDGEVLNIGNLVAGDTYFIRVTQFFSETGTLPFDICVQSIPDTRCDYGSGPYSLCDLFKADWVGADDYIFNFTADSDGTEYSVQQGGANTFLQLFNAGIPWGDSYAVEINSVFDLTDGNGATESIEVQNDEPCSLTVNPEPVTSLNPADNQANAGARFLGEYIRATPFVCGVQNWTWEFTNTDGVQLPFTYESPSSNRIIQILSVNGIQPGAVYEVRTRPNFAAGPGSFGSVELLAIVGAAGLDTEIETPIELVQTEVDRLDIDDAAAAMIYPNPNNGEMMFVNVNEVPTDLDRVLIDIYDVAGKRIVSEQLATTGGSNLNVQMPLSNLNSGMYIVNIIVGDAVYTERLTVTK